MNDRRPSWGYCPDDLSWQRLDWEDRLRVILIVTACVLVCLSASVAL